MGEMIMEGEGRGALNGRKSFRRCTHFNVSFLLQIILEGPNTYRSVQGRQLCLQRSVQLEPTDGHWFSSANLSK